MGAEHWVTVFLFGFARMLSHCKWDSYCYRRGEKQFTQAEEWSNSFWGNLLFIGAESSGQSKAELRPGWTLFLDYLLVCSLGCFMEKSSRRQTTQGILESHQIDYQECVGSHAKAELRMQHVKYATKTTKPKSHHQKKGHTLPSKLKP